MKYILVFALAFLFIRSSCAQTTKKPALHLVKGQTYYLESTGTSAIVQSIRGRENKVNLALSFRMAFKVTGIADTVYSMDVSYQSLSMKIHMADTTINMDSENNFKPDTPSTIIAAIMNKPFNIALSKSGRVLKVENLDKIMTGAFDQFPGMSAAKKDLIKSRFMQSFGEGAFKSSNEMGIAIFPNLPLIKNCKWTANTTAGSPTKINIKTNYQLTDTTPDFYQVHGDGIMSSDDDAKPEEISGLPMKYELNGAVTTDVKIDKKTGWIMELKLKQLLAGNIQIQDNPKTPGGATIPMSFNNEIVTTGK